MRVETKTINNGWRMRIKMKNYFKKGKGPKNKMKTEINLEFLLIILFHVTYNFRNEDSKLDMKQCKNEEARNAKESSRVSES